MRVVAFKLVRRYQERTLFLVVLASPWEHPHSSLSHRTLKKRGLTCLTHVRCFPSLGMSYVVLVVAIAVSSAIELGY